MSARKITPEDCFKILTRIDNSCSFPPDVHLQNGWDIFDLRVPMTSIERAKWNELRIQEATVFYLEEGEFAESTICGLMLGETMVFFDEHYDLKAELYDRVREGDAEYMSQVVKQHRPCGSTAKLCTDVTWFMTIDGSVYSSNSGNHNDLYLQAKNVLRRDIVAAGRVWLGGDMQWSSDLLKVKTPNNLIPVLEEYLKSVVTFYNSDN